MPGDAPLPEPLLTELFDLIARTKDQGALEQGMVALCAAHPEHAGALRSELQRVQADPGNTRIEPRCDRRPDRIGPYHILESLGEGGMGEVYKAERREPVRQLVAIKIIKQGLATRDILARFELERRALAAMSHRSIAKVLDAGSTRRGEPYFVMELVEGLPITTYCDRHKLSLPERLELFRQVCAAVQHAHQKGIIHRDLKPGNVHVVREGNDAVPKVLDFGLAKATNRDFLAATLITQHDQVMGTPEYMAPEQAAGDGEVIDVRADVYSLGVMLYQLLTGSLPFATADLRRAGVVEALRIIREVDPPKPSTRLTTSLDLATEIAQHRRISVSRLTRELRGDLDWVVLKALAKEPERRYEGAAGLAADIQRYLAHEPVEAGPPSASYRLKKLLRRHRGQVVAAGLVLVALVGGGIGTTLQWLRAEGLLTSAETARQDAQTNLEKLEVKSAALDRKINEFDQLAGVVRHDDVLAEVTDVLRQAPWPAATPAMQTWLRRCTDLLALRSEIERTIGSLRADAAPWTDAQRQHDLETHPDYAAWHVAEQQLRSLRRAQAIRSGGQELLVPTLSAEQHALDARMLNTMAWVRVAPVIEERKIWGEEALGLALAQRSAALDADSAYSVDTLAWAFLANGQDAKAQERSAAALAIAPAGRRPVFERYRAAMNTAISGADELAKNVSARYAALTERVRTRRTWTFDEAHEAQGFLHDTLEELLEKLNRLEAGQNTLVARRLAWSRQIEELSRAHPNAPVTWRTVREQIRTSERYRGQTIELQDRDVVGLVPLGANPATGYFEFYHLGSAWDGERDPREVPIPVHRDDGSIEVTDDSGIVFVLLPGGTVTVGSTRDPAGPNHDPAARTEYPPQQVSLSPFFLARHEMTQGQWARLWCGKADLREPSDQKAGDLFVSDDAPINFAHPVESVDWWMCRDVLDAHGLVLPTEAQWEYGCRGGTTTPWLSPFDELRHHANLADATAKQVAPSWTCEAWTDGHVIHAPVGTFRPNAYGLYDVHGNVWEWCLDHCSPYDVPTRAGDGYRPAQPGTTARAFRGGGYDCPALYGRCADRSSNPPSARRNSIGLRAARVLTVTR